MGQVSTPEVPQLADGGDAFTLSEDPAHQCRTTPAWPDNREHLASRRRFGHGRSLSRRNEVAAGAYRPPGFPSDWVLSRLSYWVRSGMVARLPAFRGPGRRGGPLSGRGPWVLVVESGRGQNRSALAAVRALAQAGYRAALTVSSPNALAAASRYCQRVVITVPVDDPGFAAAIEAELDSFPYLGVMPTSDAAITALSDPGAPFVDKRLLAKRATDVGLPVPRDRVFETSDELLNSARDLDYPVVVKTSLKFRSNFLPARLINSPAELDTVRETPGPLMVQEYIPGEMHSLNGVMWKGRLVVAVHQRHLAIWPPVCGDACLAVTTEATETLKQQVVRLLDGYNGVFQIEMLGEYLLDVNPRVYGSVDLAVDAGVNLVGVYWDLVRGVPVEPAAPRIGVTYCWWEGEARRMLLRLRGGEATALHSLPAVAGRFVTRELWGDPMPMVARVRYVRQGRRRQHAGPLRWHGDDFAEGRRGSRLG
jgi:ATP-grasp in the biosynthetic pathway with Ter operon